MSDGMRLTDDGYLWVQLGDMDDGRDGMLCPAGCIVCADAVKHMPGCETWKAWESALGVSDLRAEVERQTRRGNDLHAENEKLLDEVERLREEREQVMAAAELCARDVAFWAHVEGSEGTKLGVYLLMNDTFGYASADAEAIILEECPEMLRKVDGEGWPAAVRWVAERRRERPIEPVEESMAAVDAMRERAEKAERERDAAKRLASDLNDSLREFLEGEDAEALALWDTACRERDAAQAQVARLRGVVAELEWPTGEWLYTCPICHEIQADGHRSDCRLAIALAADEPTPEPQGCDLYPNCECGPTETARCHGTPEPADEECETCGGAEWVWGHEADIDDYETDNRYSCPDCNPDTEEPTT